MVIAMNTLRTADVINRSFMNPFQGRRPQGTPSPHSACSRMTLIKTQADYLVRALRFLIIFRNALHVNTFSFPFERPIASMKRQGVTRS